MPQPYDLTNASNMSGINNLFTTANQMSNNLFGVIILLMLWFIIFMQLKNYSSKPAMLAASFITAIASILLFLINMVSSQVLIICIILTAIVFVMNWNGD